MDTEGVVVCMGCATSSVESHRRSSGVVSAARGLIIVGISLAVFTAGNFPDESGDIGDKIALGGVGAVAGIMVLVGVGLAFSKHSPASQSPTVKTRSPTMLSLAIVSTGLMGCSSVRTAVSVSTPPPIPTSNPQVALASPAPSSSSMPLSSVPLPAVSDAAPPEYREIALWAREQPLVRTQAECGAGAEIGAWAPVDGHIASPDRVDQVYQVYCDRTWTQGFGGPVGAPGDADYAEFSHEVELSEGTLFLVSVSGHRRQIHGPYCKTHQGYESSWSCRLFKQVVTGGPGFLDLLLLVEEGCSDAGCDAELKPLHLSQEVDVPELTLPDERDLVAFKVPAQGMSIEVRSHVVELDVSVACTEQEWQSEGHENCSLPKRYRIEYDRGTLQVEELRNSSDLAP